MNYKTIFVFKKNFFFIEVPDETIRDMGDGRRKKTKTTKPISQTTIDLILASVKLIFFFYTC